MEAFNGERQGTWPTLYLAILRGELDTVKKLVQGDRTLNRPLKMQQGDLPALHFAIYEGKTAIAEVLIQRGADINLKATDSESTPLMEAAKKGNIEALRLLIDAGANVHAADKIAWTALDHAAAYDGTAARPMVEALIAAGGDANRLSRTWGSPLIKACWRGNASV